MLLCAISDSNKITSSKKALTPRYGNLSTELIIITDRDNHWTTKTPHEFPIEPWKWIEAQHLFNII